MSQTCGKPYHHGNLTVDLVRIAAALLEGRGEAAVTLREVARQAGVSAAAVYRHFADKEAVMRAVAAQGFAMLSETFRDATSDIGDKTEALRVLGLAYVDFADHHPNLHALMFGARIGDREADGDLAAQAHRAFHQLLTLSAACLGIDPGDKKALGAAIALWSLVHGYAALRRNGQVAGLGHDRMPDPAEVLSALVLNGS